MGFISVIKKEFLEMVHDRTMLLVLIGFPIIIMTFMGSSFRSLEINGLPIGIVGPYNTTFSGVLFSDLNRSKAFNLLNFESEESAMIAFRNGQLRALIIVPEDFEETLGRGGGSKIKIVVDNSDLALEQSLIAAMSSVVQASSANITKTYVSTAWQDLYALNTSAGALANNISLGRMKMQNTSAKLSEIKQNMSDFEINSLEDLFDQASSDVLMLQNLLSNQKEALVTTSENNELFFNNSEAFLYNASFALNESIETVGDTHEKLVGEVQELNSTVLVLTTSIAGLEAIKANSTDNTTIIALELNIESLTAVKNSTQLQMLDAQDEIQELEQLNDTLQTFSNSLEYYSQQLELAKQGQNDIAKMAERMENASTAIAELNRSLNSARSDVNKLKDLLTRINSTMSEIQVTLDDALSQTGSVDSLILSLQKTVAEQTGKDPERIATPISVSVENQYARASFVDFIIPQIISVSLLLSCFLLSSMSIVREKTRNTIIRALMVPGALTNLVVGKIITLVFLSLGQVTLILVVAMVFFGVTPPDNLLVLLWGTTISSLVLSSVGILVGFYAKTGSAAIQTCLLLAIPMLFLGNIIFSPDLLPNYTQILQQLLPLAHITNIYKIVLITNGNPALDIAALLSYFILLALALTYIVIRRRDVSNFY